MSEQGKIPNTRHDDLIRDIDALAPGHKARQNPPRSPAGRPAQGAFSKPYRVRIDASLPANDTTDEAYELAESDGDERTIYSGPPVDQDGATTGPVCAVCGYSLRGLKTPRCPECGNVEHAPRQRSGITAEMRRESRHVARKTYLKPIIPGLIGVVLFLAVAALVNDPRESAILCALVPVGVVLAIVGIKIAEWMTDSSDDYLILTALRCVAAICLTLPLVYGLIHVLGAAVGIRIIGAYLIPTVLATFVAMWVWEENQFDDAILRGIALTLACYIIAIAARVIA